MPYFWGIKKKRTLLLSTCYVSNLDSHLTTEETGPERQRLLIAIKDQGPIVCPAPWGFFYTQWSALRGSPVG